MGKPLHRLLGVSNKPVEGEEEVVVVMTMMMGMQEARGVTGWQEQQEEEAGEAVEEEEGEEAAEAKGEQLGETPVNPQTMGRTQTQSQT